MNIFRLIARPLLASPFILSGLDAVKAPADRREAVQKLSPALAAAGVHLDERTTDLATRALGGLQIVAGGLLALGKAPRLSAATLALTELPLTLAGAPALKGGTSGAERRHARRDFATGAGLIGGALLAAFDRVGKPSLSYRVSSWVDQRQNVREAKQQVRKNS